MITVTKKCKNNLYFENNAKEVFLSMLPVSNAAFKAYISSFSIVKIEKLASTKQVPYFYYTPAFFFLNFNFKSRN